MQKFKTASGRFHVDVKKIPSIAALLASVHANAAAATQVSTSSPIVGRDSSFNLPNSQATSGTPTLHLPSELLTIFRAKRIDPSGFIVKPTLLPHLLPPSSTASPSSSTLSAPAPATHPSSGVTGGDAAKKESAAESVV